MKSLVGISMGLLLSGLVLGGGLWGYRQAGVRVTHWVEAQIQKEQNRAGFHLKWDRLFVSLWSVRVHIEGVRLEKPSFEPVEVSRVVISPDFRSLLVGKFLVKVTLFQPRIRLVKGYFPPPPGGGFTQPVSLKSLWKNLRSLPGVYLSLRQGSWEMEAGGHPVEVLNMRADVRVHPPSQEVSLKVSSEAVKVQGHPVFSVVFNGKVQGEKMVLKTFKVRNERSWWEAQARKNKSFYEARLRSSFDSADLLAWAQMYDPEFEGFFSGKVNMVGRVSRSSSGLKGNFDFSASSFSLKNIFLSRVKAHGHIRRGRLYFDHFRIHHPHQWRLTLPGARVKLKKPYAFETRLRISETELADVFKTTGLRKVPVSAGVKGRMHCHGLLQSFSLICEGKNRFQDIVVRGRGGKTILHIPRLRTQNRFEVSKRAFTSTVRGSWGSSSRLSFQGVYHPLKKLFEARYGGDLDLTRGVGDLVGLSPKGRLTIQEGRLRVQGQNLQIEAALGMEDFILSRYRVGRAKTQFQYMGGGQLHFNRIQGGLASSRYRGRLSIDVEKDSLKGFASFPRLHLSDLRQALSQRWHIPFELEGVGSLSVYLNTPLIPNRLSYQLQSRFRKVRVAGEPFREALIDLKSEGSHIQTKQVRFLKGDQGQVHLQGSLSPAGLLKATLKGEKLRLQNIHHWTQWTGAGTILGDLSFDMDLKGSVKNPVLQGGVEVSQSSFMDRPLKDSSLKLLVSKDRVEATGQVAGTLNVERYVFPYRDFEPVRFQAQVSRFNLSDFFFSKQVLSYQKNQFESRIDGKWDLSYQRRRALRSLTGTLSMNRFHIKSESETLKNLKPFAIEFQKGRMLTQGFELHSGGDRKLKVSPTPPSSGLQVRGDMELGFLAFLAPFLKDLKGDMNVNLHTTDRLYDLQMKGQARVMRAVVWPTEELEPFEDISAVLDIQRALVHIRSLRAVFGGGDVRAYGKISFQKKNLVPVHITGFFDRVLFDSLPGFSALGSGKLQVKGNRFPYTLSVTSDLLQARMDREIGGGGFSASSVEVSPLLPKETKKGSGPFLMDIRLSLVRPGRVRNSSIQALVKGDLHIHGPVLSPVLSGRLQALPGGVLTFRDHEFDLVSGTIRYQNNEPANPFLDLTARTTLLERGADTQNEYGLLLRVTGSGGKPSLRLTSTPDLTENEIVSLLAFGTRSIVFETGDTVSDVDKYSYYSYQIGTAMLERAIGQEVKNTFGVDQFSIVSHRNPKKRSTATKLIVGKKILNNLTILASQTFLEDQPESDIKAEYQIRNHVSLVGFWKNEQAAATSDIGNNELGFDVEYNIDF